MALLLKDGSIFLHVPKTGGTWVSSVLHQCGLVRASLGHKHSDMDWLHSAIDNRRCRMRGLMDLARIRRALKPGPFMFCFVRHPLDWFESWFKYMVQPSRAWCDWGDEKSLFGWHPNAVLNGCGSDDFNQFIRNVIAKRPGYATELFSGFARPQIGAVGRQESLREDLVRVLKRLELDFDEDFVRGFDPVHVSPEPARDIEWDPELRREMLVLESVALRRFGYESPPVAKLTTAAG